MFKKIFFVLAISLFMSLLTFNIVKADTNNLEIWFFHSNGCPHCAKAKPVLEQIAKDNDNVELIPLELTSSTENQEKFLLMAEIYNKEADGVPTVLIGDYWIEGFDPLKYRQAVQYCLKNKCENPSVKYNNWLKNPAHKDALNKYSSLNLIEDKDLDSNLYKAIAFLFLVIFITFVIVIVLKLRKK